MSPLRFVLKSLLVASLPLALLAALYTVADPFKVLRRTDWFADDVSVNKGVVTATNYRQRHEAGAHYDAFIFGSSLSCYYRADDWRRYLPAGASVYHLDSSGQTTLTMRRMAEMADRGGDTIRHALVILDPFIFNVERERDAMVYLDPPQIRDEWWYAPWFHARMFSHFADVRFLSEYLPWRFGGVRRGDLIFEPQPIVWDSVANEETMPLWDAAIEADAEAFHARSPLPPVPDRYTAMPDAIDTDERADLEAIAAIFARHDTDFRVIIGPNRRRALLSEADDSTLRAIFGDRYLNLGREFAPDAADPANFYDPTHYRHPLARRLLLRAYTP